MLYNNSDDEWEKFGKDDPYYGVVSDDKYRNTNLTTDAKEVFFMSGLDYVEHILQKIRQHINPVFSIKRALDFGCGVGRLVIPLSKLSENVTGIDISDSMLCEARKNCDSRDIKNVTLLKSDDCLSLLSGKYDFIHSFIHSLYFSIYP
jgi:2-polyprenyl-3-methyl-5-hydroxy-6-metoxy-1,4-benzoquinol methylase